MAAKYYGVPIRAYLTKLTAARAAYPERLLRRTRYSVNRFVRATGIDMNDGPAHRVAKAFGLNYAAGELARRYGVLPSGWQEDILDCILTCYRAHVDASQSAPSVTSPRSALDQIRTTFAKISRTL